VPRALGKRERTGHGRAEWPKRPSLQSSVFSFQFSVIRRPCPRNPMYLPDGRTNRRTGLSGAKTLHQHAAGHRRITRLLRGGMPKKARLTPRHLPSQPGSSANVIQRVSDLLRAEHTRPTSQPLVRRPRPRNPVYLPDGQTVGRVCPARNHSADTLEPPRRITRLLRGGMPKKPRLTPRHLPSQPGSSANGSSESAASFAQNTPGLLPNPFPPSASAKPRVFAGRTDKS